MSKRIIWVDAGHGGHDSGAVGPWGLREKDVALDVALLMGSLLGANFDVRYTRTTDEFVGLEERAMRANKATADLFVSIHCNSAKNPAKGFEVFTTPGETDSDAAATEAFWSYAATFPGKTKRQDTSDGDPDKEASFAVLRLTRCPAYLFELEFIHTEEGEAFLASPINRQMMARALAFGVERFFKLPPPTVPVPTAPLPESGTPGVLVLLQRFHMEQLTGLTESKRLVGELTAHLDEQDKRLRGIATKIAELNEGGRGA
jgi:N-acetylmuramoyl-L-alanine amidase